MSKRDKTRLISIVSKPIRIVVVVVVIAVFVFVEKHIHSVSVALLTEIITKLG